MEFFVVKQNLFFIVVKWMYGVQFIYYNVYCLKGVFFVIDLYVYMRVKLVSVLGKEREGVQVRVGRFFLIKENLCVCYFVCE